MLYKSSKQIMDRTMRELKPEFTFDTDGERMVWRQYFDDGAYNTRYFSRSQMCIILHVHYIEDKNPDRLQKLVDSGELYDYLTNLYDRVEDAVIMLDINDLHILCHSPVDSMIDPINDLSVILSNVVLNVNYYNQNFFSLLLNDEEIKREILGIFTEEIYNSLKKAAEE